MEGKVEEISQDTEQKEKRDRRHEIKNKRHRGSTQEV